MALVSSLLLGLVLQQPPAAQDVQTLGWPRELAWKGHTVTAYQPQVDAWEKYTVLRARMAVEVQRDGAPAAHFGAVHLRAVTRADFATRRVLIDDIRVDKVVYPSSESTDTTEAEAIVRSIFGRGSFVVELDRLTKGLARGQEQQREIDVGASVPLVMYSDRPAVLVQTLGAPQMRPIPGTDLQYVLNTNWDLLSHPSTKRYFLRNGDTWLVATGTMDGGWAVARELPLAFGKLPPGLDWSTTAEHVPGHARPGPPRVFLTRQPSELIVTDGPPRRERIADTNLMHVTNTRSDLFWFAGDDHYYFCVAGRWLRAKNLKGPWSAAAELPADFLRIPDGHPEAQILAAVPGTPAALEAVIQASIPRKATVQRSATAHVTYDGDPRFEKIAGTAVSCATNTRFDVFRVEGDAGHYLCHRAVWFVAKDAKGPWNVCDAVPKPIYAIPVSHPRHHATYVFVYESTPENVVVGYTAGYKGLFVSGGVPVFGAGVWSPAQAETPAQVRSLSYRPAHHYGFGCGAFYSVADATFYRAHDDYGPYRGVGRGAVYDPAAGAWVRGVRAHGPSSSRVALAADTPWSGVYGAAMMQSHGYASWGAEVAAEGQWARPVAKGTKPAPTAPTPTATKPPRVAGPPPSLRPTQRKQNNVLVGADGNHYRYANGRWQKLQGRRWVDVAPGARTQPQAAGGQPAAAGTGTGGAPSAEARAKSQYWSQMARDQYARQRSAASAGRAAVGPTTRKVEVPTDRRRWWW